jgi:ATP-binding cassette subfamily C (CFTR/MRP) protein 1
LKINLKAKNGKLIAVVGKVGSGKSSLLSTVLGVIPKISGDVTVNGKLAYVSQDAWIINAKLKQNITMHDPSVTTNLKRYQETIRVCELERDLEILANSDDTEIGQRGFNLRSIFHEIHFFMT